MTEADWTMTTSPFSNSCSVSLPVGTPNHCLGDETWHFTNQVFLCKQDDKGWYPSSKALSHSIGRVNLRQHKHRMHFGSSSPKSVTMLVCFPKGNSGNSCSLDQDWLQAFHKKKHDNSCSLPWIYDKSLCSIGCQCQSMQDPFFWLSI